MPVASVFSNPAHQDRDPRAEPTCDFVVSWIDTTNAAAPLRVSRADSLGRTGEFSTEAQEWFIGKARALGVEEKPPGPILMGRHLLEMGLGPGPVIGRITRAVYEMQLDGRVTDLEGALRAAKDLIEAETPA